MMKLSNKGFDLINKYETGGNLKKYLTAYLDPVGVWTIGIGSTYYENGTKVKKGDVITEARARQLFANNIRSFENAVNSAVTVPITQAQFDALVSFAYNVGAAAFRNSTLLKRINAKASRVTIEAEFLRWKYGTISGVKTVLNGLLKRRIEESQMFLNGVTPIVKSVSTFSVILVAVLGYWFITK